MDTVYISHGSPTLCIDESIPARHFLKAWQDKALCPRPKSILIISGHWDTALPSVNVITGPNDTIHDFYGFPKNMYKPLQIADESHYNSLDSVSALIIKRNGQRGSPCPMGFLFAS